MTPQRNVCRKALQCTPSNCQSNSSSEPVRTEFFDPLKIATNPARFGHENLSAMHACPSGECEAVTRVVVRIGKRELTFDRITRFTVNREFWRSNQVAPPANPLCLTRFNAAALVNSAQAAIK